MEEDKKRKKNKKKKNKQNKAAGNSSDGAGEHITSGQNHDQETSQKNMGRVHEIKDAQGDVFPEEQLRNVANGPEVVSLNPMFVNSNNSSSFFFCCPKLGII